MPRREAGAQELAALDPDTGEVLDAGDAPPPLLATGRLVGLEGSSGAHEPTGTMLVGRTASEVVVVDIDASAVRRRPAPGRDGVFAVGDSRWATAGAW